MTTDFAGRVSAQSAVRAGEVIVSLKSGKFEAGGARADGFNALSARHSLQPAAQSRGQYRLMRSATKFAAAKFASGHAKFSAMANDAVRARSEVAHLIKALKADPDVEHAEPNFIYQRHATTNDPLSQMWHLEDINVGNAWDTTTGDPTVVVAVIDGGVLAQHPDFLGQNSEGYDFISSSGNYDGDGIDPDPEDVTPLDDPCSPDGQAFYHGAHVAGTVGATGNNEEGIVGISYGASLMHLRALDGDCGVPATILVSQFCMPLAHLTTAVRCPIRPQAWSICRWVVVVLATSSKRLLTRLRREVSSLWRRVVTKGPIQ